MVDNTKKPWGGRFKKGTHPEMEYFSQSLDFDRRLGLVDVRAGIAHAKMLGRQGIITKKDCAAIVKGLKAVGEEIADGAFPYRVELEDIHMNVERRLTELIGPVGGKLHTGRSRNDQVATDLRLWLRDEIDAATSEIKELVKALDKRSREHSKTPMPGYTHLQRAQPVTFGFHMSAYAEMLRRDLDRLADCRRRVNVMPLGAGALAGSTLPLDPESVAKELGFDAACANSMDAVADRDFAAEFLFDAALCQVHMSRMAEEFVLWSTSEFDFIELPEDFTTGSSIMPQKRNPDSAELVRGKTGRVVGSLVALLIMLKGLPLAYNRDFQEDKEPVFDAADTLRSCVRIMTHLVADLKVHKAVLKDALKKGHPEATDLAEYLVRKGMPFREAHEIVGKMVLDASERGLKLADLDIDVYRKASRLFDTDIYAVLDPLESIKRRGALSVKAPAKKAKPRNDGKKVK